MNNPVLFRAMQQAANLQANQLANLQANLQTNQLANLPANRLANQLANRLANQLTNRLVNRLVNRLANQLANQLASLFLLSLFLLSLALTTGAYSEETASAEPATSSIQLESGFFSVDLSPNAMVLSAVERQTGTNWLAPNGQNAFAWLVMQKGAAAVMPEKLEWTDETHSLLKLTFQNHVEAILRYESCEAYYTLEVVSVSQPFYRMAFGCVPLKPDYTRDDAFGFSTLILTLPTNTLEFPGKATRLGALCYDEIGCQGAKAAFVGVPEKQMRRVMQDVTEWILKRSAEDPAYRKLAPPVSRAGGGFAMDIPKNHGSYIITSDAVTAEQVPAWAEHLAQFGVNQLDFHQGGAFRQGDFHFNTQAYPNGVADFRRMTDELQKHDMIAGLHTYSEFIAANSKFVTPVPHEDLDVLRTFTLAEDLDEQATAFSVEESMQGVSLICGFTVKNSLFLRVDDEIIAFHGLSPNGFTECQRGACGTRASCHSKGAKIRHLTQYYGNFVANPTSELFLEVARETARAYDEGGFRMIYLDALDGTSSILPNSELAWYYDALFVREMLTHITTEPPLLEYSTMHPSLWAARSRMGAWDSPARGYEVFTDLHTASNVQTADRCYLPSQMGWFTTCPTRPLVKYWNLQFQYLHREALEYFGAKALAYDAGLSYLDISLGAHPAATIHNGHVLKTFDELRRQRYFPPELCEQVKTPGKHFHLKCTQGTEGEHYDLVPAEYTTLKPTQAQQEFTVTNPFGAQKPYLRIENRYAVESYDDEAKALELIPFDENQPAKELTTKEIPEPYLDLSTKSGLGLWVFGDGQGQILNIRVESPAYMLSGFTDHYAKLDHTGWKYFEFAECDNGLFPELKWPAGQKGFYAEFRQAVNYEAISGIHVMIKGPSEGLRFRTLKAIDLRETTLTDPIVTIGGQTVTLKGSIPSGCFAEITPESDEILVKDARGYTMGTLEASAPIPALPAGESQLQLPWSPDAPRSQWILGVCQ